MRRYLLIGLSMLSLAAEAAPPPEAFIETRICGITRNASGDIVRSQAVVRAFKRIHPCPNTGLPTGSCVGWAVDHVIPLASGGCDYVSNMQWLPNSIKRTSDPDNKDRWERKINAVPPVIVNLP